MSFCSLLKQTPKPVSQHLIHHLNLQHRQFGITAMRAWLKRQEKAKFDKKLEEKEQKRVELKNAKNWQPNELYDNNPLRPIKVPDIQSLFNHTTNKDTLIQSTIEAIDANTESDIDGHPYQIYCLFVIERLPIINRVFEHQQEYHSLLREVKLQQRMPSLFSELYVDQLSKRDRERQKNLRIRPRVTVDDQNSEIHSLNRSLDQRLYLICKQMGKEYWEFPWSQRQYDETLFETANRGLVDRIGPYLHYATINTLPFGHVQYEAQAGEKGAQLFFQKAYYVSGNARLNVSDLIEDFGWFTKQELQGRLNPVLWQSIHSLLME